MGDATIVIPWRDGGCEYRRRNMGNTVAHLEQLGWPIILADSPGKDFNLSAARNAGVAQASTEIVVIVDADFYPHLHVLINGVRSTLRDGKVRHLAKRLAYLDEVGTGEILAGRTLRRGKIIHRSLGSPGGFVALTREAWDRIGGYDENYRDWGYEDLDWNDRAADIVGIEPAVIDCWHLWHPPAKRGEDTADNRALYHSKRAARKAGVSTDGQEPEQLPDVVYRVKQGENNPELLYSLRSLANFPHRRVWMVGHKPAWVKNVHHIEGNRHGRQKWANGWNNIELACGHPEISDPFVLVDDDMYFLEKTKTIPMLHRDSLRAQVDRTPPSGWKTTLASALTWLEGQGIMDPSSYEVHIPYVVHKAQMMEVFSKARDHSWPNPPQWRTIDANYWKRGGVESADVKVAGPGFTDFGQLLSTTDSTFKHVRRELESRFPRKSRYEA